MANDRDCENCKHHREVRKNGKFYRFCESWDCGFEPREPVRNPDQLTSWIVPIILIDEKGEEHDGLMDMRRMLIYLHNIPAETAISLGYTWKSAEGSEEE